MSRNRQQHRREVWDRFWLQNQQIETVYSNSDRVLTHLLELGPVAGKKILEVGAGSGRDSLFLAAQGATVFTLDYSERALAIIRQLAAQSRQRLWLIRGDAFHLPIKSESLDVVFHQGLLEHFTDPITILRENYRSLKVGGFALADVPQRYHIYTVVKHFLIAVNRWFAGWETEFSLPQLQKLFRQAGFILHSAYGDWMRPSFIYRALRQLFKKLSWQWPLYPPSLLGLAALRARIRQRLYRTSWAHYTFMDIGVIGKKET